MVGMKKICRTKHRSPNFTVALLVTLPRSSALSSSFFFLFLGKEFTEPIFIDASKENHKRRRDDSFCHCSVHADSHAVQLTFLTFLTFSDTR
jgi:hypothetical protein